MKSTQIHPLYLHQTDHPGLILISKKPTGSDNYSSLKISLKIALNAKNKMKIITGEFVKPRMDYELRALWERNNDISVEVYYQKLKGLWDEFDALEASYLCLCICSCANDRINGERDQRNRLIQFLMRLDECFSNIRGQILLMQPLPTAAKAYTMVRQEKKQREGIAPKSTSSTILNNYSNKNNAPNTHNHSKYNVSNTPNSRFTSQRPTQTNFERRSSFRKGVYCGNCRKEGHLQEECYKIVGYPIGHPLYGKDQNKRIALGSLYDGLYFLNSLPKVSATTPTILYSSSKSQLWHSRLGHPSLTVLKKIKCLSHFIPCTFDFQCNICKLSKQSALPFHSSTSHATSLFELVHIDV
ncbi:cysteine-rich receptor-like protein kinase 8 [Tanacetum coccineum]